MSVVNQARDRDARGRLIRSYRGSGGSLKSPGWWVHIHMKRPRRHANRRFCNAVLHGRDPDSLPWPGGARKPHLYYW